MISQLFPILATTDITRSLAFYRDLLGGVVSFEYPGPDGKLVYAGIDIGSSHLGIGVTAGLEARPLPRAIALWVYTEDCDATVGRLRQAGMTILAEPADQPWGERIARVVDPDGNEIIIGQRASSA